MNAKGFARFSWGFLFIMFDFKISGFDILPDLIGYLFFAAGFSLLSAHSAYFIKGWRFNIPTSLLSLLYIYEFPSKDQGQLIHFGPLGLLGIPVAIISFVFGLMVVYYLFMGIKEMAVKQEKPDLFDVADNKWRQYLYLQIASILAILLVIIPFLAFGSIIALLIISFIIMMDIMRFMRKCGECM